MTTYRIWRDGSDEHDPDQLPALGPRDAAARQAEHDHADRNGWEWSWPVTYVVEDTATGQRWRVEVDRRMKPWFRPGGAVEVSR